jgi:hypothetical protein
MNISEVAGDHETTEFRDSARPFDARRTAADSDVREKVELFLLVMRPLGLLEWRQQPLSDPASFMDSPDSRRVRLPLVPAEIIVFRTRSR